MGWTDTDARIRGERFKETENAGYPRDESCSVPLTFPIPSPGPLAASSPLPAPFSSSFHRFCNSARPSVSGYQPPSASASLSFSLTFSSLRNSLPRSGPSLAPFLSSSPPEVHAFSLPRSSADTRSNAESWKLVFPSTFRPEATVSTTAFLLYFQWNSLSSPARSNPPPPIATGQHTLLRLG